MKKVIFTALLLLAYSAGLSNTALADSVPSTTAKELTKQSQDLISEVMNGSVSDEFDAKQFELELKLDELRLSNPDLNISNYITTAERALAESRELVILRNIMQEQNGAAPTAGELMQMYFQTKASI